MRQISFNRRSNRILYNVTVSLEASIFPEWLTFMREEHIPKIFATGCFSGYKICRIVDESVESYSIAVQYFADNEETFKIYKQQILTSWVDWAVYNKYNNKQCLMHKKRQIDYRRLNLMKG